MHRFVTLFFLVFALWAPKPIAAQEAVEPAGPAGPVFAQEATIAVACADPSYPATYGWHEGEYRPREDMFVVPRGGVEGSLWTTLNVTRLDPAQWRRLETLNGPMPRDSLSADMVIVTLQPCQPLYGLRELGLLAAVAPTAEIEALTAENASLRNELVEAQNALNPRPGLSGWQVAILILLILMSFLIGVAVTAIWSGRMIADRDARAEELEREIGRLRVQLSDERGAHMRELAALREEHEAALEAQRTLDFQARRAMMAPLPEGVEDAVLAGPPMRHEGATEDNLDEIAEEAMLETYQRRHPGARVDDLRFERRNTRRVLISSRSGETFQMTYGDGVTREVTLVREPGWVFDGRIIRGQEVLEELPGIAVVGPCGNRFEYFRTWIVGAHIEPYEFAAIHTAPDWEAVGAERARRRVELRAVDGHVVVSRGDQTIIDADYVVLDSEGVEPDGDGFRLIAGARLLPGRTEPQPTDEQLAAESAEADESETSETDAEPAPAGD